MYVCMYAYTYRHINIGKGVYQACEKGSRRVSKGLQVVPGFVQEFLGFSGF